MPMRAVIAAHLVAVAAGIAWMVVSGAPSTYAVMNAAAAFLAVAIAGVLYRRPDKRQELVALWAAPTAMAASMAIGPDVDGVHRWLAIGPLRLHAAALFGPAFLVAFQRRTDWSGPAAVIIAAALVTIQPDMSVALALACSVGLALIFDFQPVRLVALAASLVALGLTASRPDGLDPLPFVENVLQDVVDAGGMPGIAIPLAFVLAIAAPFFGQKGQRAEGAAISSWFLGLTVASLLAPYPTPLIGYGAAPIIGYGIAIGLLGRVPATNAKLI